MLMELPISEKKYNEVREVENKKRDHVYFQILDARYDDSLFIFCHGNKQGDVVINGYVFTAENILDGFLTKPEFKKRGYTEIVLICCHGGLIEPITKEGVTIKSIHNSPNEIYCKGNATIDDEYLLSIVV